MGGSAQRSAVELSLSISTRAFKASPIFGSLRPMERPRVVLLRLRIRTLAVVLVAGRLPGRDLGLPNSFGSGALQEFLRTSEPNPRRHQSIKTNEQLVQLRGYYLRNSSPGRKIIDQSPDPMYVAGGEIGTLVGSSLPPPFYIRSECKPSALLIGH